MEAKEDPKFYSIALTISLVVILTWAWKVVNWVWFRPKRIERRLRQQGLRGKSYRILFGDLKENAMMVKEAKTKPIAIGEDISPRVTPLLNQFVKNYGKNCFMWIGPIPRVTIINPEQIRDILTKINDFPKPNTNPMFKLLAAGLASHEGQKWSLHRKIINPAFHFEKLKLMVPAMYECCIEMMDKWESLVSSKNGAGELDVLPYFQNLASDVISRTAFGSNYEEGKRTFELLKEQTTHALKALQHGYVPGWRFVPTKTNRVMKKIDKEIQALLKNVIHKKEKAMKAGEATRDDLLGLLMESNSREMTEHKNNGLSMEDVIDECKLFYFAGQETTSNLLTWTMILLAKHSDWQVRAREEIVQVFGDKEPDFDGLGHLKVVTMILHEVLRLYPPVVILARAINEDTKLGDLVLPKGVQVSLPILLMQTDPKLWGDDALEFKPERFSGGISKATKNVQVAYFPFGWGPRICIGQNFAIVEAKMALAMMLRRFSFELSPSYVHAPTALITLQPQHGAQLMLHKL